MKYFAYGSNLNIEQMKSRCPDSVGVSAAVLSGWRLVERTYADIEAGVLDSINKFSFYQQLAEAASETIERNPAVGAAELCRKVVEKAKSIYMEME